jgi:hypothetical protein
LFLLDLGGEDITPDFNNPEGGKTPMCWKQPQVHGKGPGPRFDHCSTLFPGKFVLSGGQDNVEMKRDIHYMDVETMTWAEESGLSPQIYGFDLCNHYAGAIESVPNYKVSTNMIIFPRIVTKKNVLRGHNLTIYSSGWM